MRNYEGHLDAGVNVGLTYSAPEGDGSGKRYSQDQGPGFYLRPQNSTGGPTGHRPRKLSLDEALKFAAVLDAMFGRDQEDDDSVVRWVSVLAEQLPDLLQAAITEQERKTTQLKVTKAALTGDDRE